MVPLVAKLDVLLIWILPSITAVNLILSMLLSEDQNTEVWFWILCIFSVLCIVKMKLSMRDSVPTGIFLFAFEFLALYTGTSMLMGLGDFAEHAPAFSKALFFAFSSFLIIEIGVFFFRAGPFLLSQMEHIYQGK